jgi:hypothetical protein
VVDDESEEAWMAMVLGTSVIADNEPEMLTYPEEIPVPKPVKMTPVQAFVMPPYEQQTNSSPSVEIYDSGCLRHMTPDQHCLINYCAISPKPISTANQELFSAIGAGNMYIQALNGVTSTRIRLWNVLYMPSIGSTLVLISQIDQTRYSVAFQNGKCIIHNLKDHVVAQIPKTRGLYQIEQDPIYTLSAETLTLDKLHQHHGHADSNAPDGTPDPPVKTVTKINPEHVPAVDQGN